MKYENKGNCEIFFYNYVGYFPAITHGKFHEVRRQTEVGLWECLFSLRQREKYFSYSFVISTCNMLCILRLRRQGSDTNQGNKGNNVFSRLSTCLSTRNDKYRWLLSNRVSRLPFLRTISSNGTACQLFYTQFVVVDDDFAIVISIQQNSP